MFGARPPILRDKLDMIDHAFSSLGVESFADLGGVWGVEGAYTFHALDKHEIKAAALVDTHLTPTVVDRAKSYPQLRLINGNFGDQNVADEVGDVDAIFLFDVLLHQVSPNWDSVLKMYAKMHVCLLFIINNGRVPMAPYDSWIWVRRNISGMCRTPRYRKPYRNLFEKLDEKHPDHDRAWRDVHHIWQWGITDDDLEAAVARLGFDLKYKKECGRFGRLANFTNRAFIFSR